MRKLSIGIMGVLALTVASFSSAATLSFSGADTLTKGCPAEIQIMMDTEGEGVNSAGVNVLLDDSFEVNAYEGTDGIFRTYTKAKELDARKGDFKGQKYLRVVGTTSSPNDYVGAGEFAKFTITPKADSVTLGFYMIPGFDGEDTNLVGADAEGNLIDRVSRADPKTFKVVEGECAVREQKAMEIEETVVTPDVEEVEDIVADQTEVNEENIFDPSQEPTFMDKYGVYVIILVVLLVIILAVVMWGKKNKKKGKK